MVRLTAGLARRFFTHCDSPRVDTRYRVPSTSTLITGIFCGCPLPRAVSVNVSVPETPVAMASLLNTLTVNQGGLR